MEAQNTHVILVLRSTPRRKADMTDKTDAKTTETASFDAAAYDQLVAKYRQATSDEKRAEVIASNQELMEKGVKLARKLERSQLPIYAKMLHRFEENSVWDKARAVRDAINTFQAGKEVYGWAKAAYTWFRAP